MYKLQYENPSKNTLRCGSGKGIVGHQKVTSYLVVMDNLFKEFDVGIRFDMKGSTAQRTRLKAGQSLNGGRDITVALKDNDFRMHM